MNTFVWLSRILWAVSIMKQRLWLSLITYLAHCIDEELCKAIDYLREQVRVLIENQERQHKRILLTNDQQMRVGGVQGQTAQPPEYNPIGQEKVSLQVD